MKPNLMKLEFIKLNCAHLQDDLLAYHHRELSPLRQVLVRWHLAHCSHCRQEMEIMEHISTTLKEAEQTPSDNPALDAGLRAKILSNLPNSPDKYTVRLTASRIYTATL